MDEEKPPSDPVLNPGDRVPNTENTHCNAKTKRGGACPWRPEHGSEFCLNHDPTKAAERSERAKQRGLTSGAARRRRPQLSGAVSLATGEAIREFLEVSAAELALSSGDACTKSHARARLASVALELLRVGDIEARISALEEKVNQ